ncbi:hypothetical protein K438DRAFT_1955053 [Mycena galopus ATCC 62051]|nr:hypothetical protein K438DRAFT_1955053 [Mycena galopus ATCC 62051]
METDATPPTQSNTPKPPVNDEKYFFDDGDCLFFVDGFIFKLHKIILSRDPESVFRSMFSLPQGIVGSATQGNELEPIPCGDTADEFRALCWALYALPTEIQAQNDPKADIDRLVVVANMGHKYSSSSFEAWALSIVWIHCQSERDYLNGCPQNMLDGVYEAAAAGGRDDLCRLVEQKWLPRLKRGELRLRHALDFGETHDMRTFLVDAYYQQAQDMKACAPKLNTGSEVADFSRLNLTPGQLHRLLSGYCSLSLFWETCITGSWPKVGRCAQSPVNHKSTMDDIIADPKSPLDILARLKAAQVRADNTDYHCSCRKGYIGKLVSGFSVSNHFL